MNEKKIPPVLMKCLAAFGILFTLFAMWAFLSGRNYVEQLETFY